MKRQFLILALTSGLLSSVAQAGVQQFGVASYANPERDCELQSADYNEAFPGTSASEKNRSTCRISVPKFVFEQRFEYCALSAIKETNDDRFVREHDYGSQCSFEVVGEEVVFTAVRGYGFHDESTSMLYCGFTCVEASQVPPAGDSLEVIYSQELADE